MPHSDDEHHYMQIVNPIHDSVVPNPRTERVVTEFLSTPGSGVDREGVYFPGDSLLNVSG
jgi:hypothetical protein